MKKKYVIGIIAVTVLLLVGIIFFLFLPPEFKLTKGDTIELKYGEKYKDPGYKVTKFGKDYTKDIKIKNKINSKKLGTYKIIYEVRINGITFKKVRKIYVEKD